MLITGLKEGKITIDFTKLEESDARGESHYVAGGRAYFEADVLGFGVTSFTAKGFFDKLGYVEPPPNDNSSLKLILGLTIPLGTIAVATLVTLYCCWKKKQRKTHVD
jgi:phosphotransferase system  glucose/maltose/N-acetylglucosamine-specific IIC component